MKRLYLSLLCSFLVLLAQATNYTAVATGNWSSSSTWSPAGTPSAADNVTIGAGFKVTVAANTTITGITLSGGTLAVNPNIIFTVTGATSYSSGTVTSDATGSFVYSGTGAQTIFPGTYGSLTVSGNTASNKVAAGAFDVLKTLTVNNTSSGRFVLNNTATPRTFNIVNLTLSNGIVDGGTVDASAGMMTSVLNVSGNVSVAGNGSLTNSSTSHFNGLNLTGTGTLGMTSNAATPFQYNDVTVTSGASITLSTGWKHAGVEGTFLTIASGGTLNAVGFSISNLTAGGNIDIDGAIRTSALHFTGTNVATISTTSSPTLSLGSGSTVEYYGTNNQNISALDYHNLTITGTRDAGNNRQILFPNNATIGVAGAYSLDGLAFGGGGNAGLKYNGSTIDYNGTAAQSIYVNASYPYAGLTVSNNGAGVTTTGMTGTTGAILVTGKLYFTSATDAYTGSGSFTLANGATLGITSAAGITPTGNSGNVQMNGGRTYNGGAHYVYQRNATGTQSTGLGLPATVTGSVTVSLGNLANNPLLLSQRTSIASLTLGSGTLSTGTNTLTLTGALNRNGTSQTGTITAAAGTIVMKGTAAQTIPNGAISGTVDVFTVNNTSGATPAVTLGGNLTVTTLDAVAGQLGIAANTLTIFGDVNPGSGTIKASSGTVVYGGTAAQNIPAGLYEANIIRNLVLNNPESLTLNGNLMISKDLTLTTGELLPGSATLSIGGDVLRTSGSIDATGATLLLNGTVDQEIASGAFKSGSVLHLTINNSSAAASAVSLASDLNVTGMLTLSLGTLDIGSKTLTVKHNFITGGAGNAYVRTSGSGVLRINGVSGTVLFPVGNSRFNPAQVNTTGTPMQDWTVNVQDAISNVDPAFAANVPKAVSRQWNVTPVQFNNPVPLPGVELTFYYNPATDGGPSFNPALDVRVWHYLGTHWQSASGLQGAGSAYGLSSAKATGITYFSPFAISTFGASLPVSLLSFTGKRVNNVNELKWSTASEANNRGFSIERSTDGRTYESVGFVGSRGAGGNSGAVLTYAFSDAAASGRKWYYRLKQEDHDGRSKHSAVVLLSADKSGALTVDAVYPNPAKDAVSVRLQGAARSGAVLLQLTDMLGQTVSVKSLSLDAGSSTTATIDLARLAAGQYHLKAIAADGTVSETVRIVKQ